MPELKGKYIISSFKKKWKTKVFASHFLVSLTVTLLFSVLLHKIILLSLWWAVPLFLIMFGLLIFIRQQWKISEWDVARFLNQYYPQLQESSHLLLKPKESLNFLQKLQVEKVEQVLEQVEEPEYFNKKFRFSIYSLLIALAVSFGLFQIPFSDKIFSSRNTSIVTGPTFSNVPEKVLPEISSVNIKINPPAYTNKATKEQVEFNLLVEEGADVQWQITTNVPVHFVKLLFNDKAVLTLKANNRKRTGWTGRRNLVKPGFYQVSIGNKVSEYYKVEIIKDAPPEIRIQSPAPHTVIDFGMPQNTMLAVNLTDDYGIKNTVVSATISSGSGESVKFKEHQLSFNDFKVGANRYNLKKLLNLNALGMKPGDELYFFVSATDNHHQEKKSDVYIITLPDTAQLMSMEGMNLGVNLKPEYFRSQRQIIIETEQLLKDKDTLHVQVLNNRSNNLGIDQKLLRLRYGKFLGEESENEIGEHHDHEEDEHNEAADFGNAEKIMDEYAHKHDNAEDATYFEPELKAQLKATLNEMWKAELQLRLNKPQQALPFEYKALRLLKDLQQKSRVYVAKTGFKSTPLKPEKRLTGELDKIIKPLHRQQVEKKKDVYEISRKAAGILGLLKADKPVSADAISMLQQASFQLYNKASEQPAVFLPAVTSINRLLAAVSKQQNPKISDIKIAENGLQKLLSELIKLPAVGEGAPAENLSAEYFKNLNSGKQ